MNFTNRRDLAMNGAKLCRGAQLKGLWVFQLLIEAKMKEKDVVFDSIPLTYEFQINVIVYFILNF